MTLNKDFFSYVNRALDALVLSNECSYYCKWMLQVLEDQHKGETCYNFDEFENMILNGSKNWGDASFNGDYLVYTKDLAEVFGFNPDACDCDELLTLQADTLQEAYYTLADIVEKYYLEDRVNINTIYCI